ncbi:MAG: hypothetical protein HYV63_16585 [Candidatus Schekmanbacteria bacterium]|nr:hypothetical protein [Candidatus Schekmanbacteria bacterium]
MKRLLVLVPMMAMLFGSIAHADEPAWYQNFKISGNVFGDVYWVAKDHNKDIEGSNGYWIRRVYLTFDPKITDTISGRLRFEASSAGDFTTSANMVPFVKDAYVQWKLASQELYIGLSGTPTFDLVESEWGYRPVEKTPLDLWGYGSSRDFGLALKGKALDKKLLYHAMLGNGSGTKGETDQGKKAMAAIGFAPTESFLVQAYVDFENRPGDTNRKTYQVFAGFKGGWGRVGALAARQTRDSADGEDVDLDLVSLYGVVNTSDNSSLLARYDKTLDVIPGADKISYYTFDKSSKSNLLIVGWDYRVHKRFSVIPNVSYAFYDAEGDAEAPDDDIIAKLTFSLSF